MSSTTFEKLETFCSETGMTKTATIEKVLDQYFDVYFDLPEEKRGLFQINL